MPISAEDIRLQKCGFAKLQGEDLDFYFKKYEIILGRRSKSTALDVVLGDNMNISRQHAVIRYNFESKAWELIVQGKNGVTVNGNLFTPQSQPATLHSQDLMQIGDRTFYFLLPRAPRKKARRRTPSVQAPPAAAAAAGAGMTPDHAGHTSIPNHIQQQQQYRVAAYTPTPEAGTPYSEGGYTPGYSEAPDNGYTPGSNQQHSAGRGDQEQHGYSQQQEEEEEEEDGEEGYEGGYEQQEGYEEDEDDQEDGGYEDQQGQYMQQEQGGGYGGAAGQQMQPSYPYSNGGGTYR